MKINTSKMKKGGKFVIQSLILSLFVLTFSTGLSRAQVDSVQKRHVAQRTVGTASVNNFSGSTIWRYNAVSDQYQGGGSALTGWGEIHFHHFDFNIPSNVIIKGIKVSFDKWGTATSNELKVRLKEGTTYSHNKADSLTSWPTTAAGILTGTYGGPNDLWGFSSISPAMLNNDTFGFAFEGIVVSGGGPSLGPRPSLNIKNPTVTVYYEELRFNHDAAAVVFTEPVDIHCADSLYLKMVVKNEGKQPITNMKVGWSENGGNTRIVNYNDTLAPYNATSGKKTDTVTIGMITTNTTTPVNIKAWTYSPNNQTDSNPANDTISHAFLATDFVISATSDTVCKGSNVTLNLSPSTGAIQWQNSTNGTTWTNISNNLNPATYTSGSLSADQWYRVNIDGSNCYSNIQKITISDPSVLGWGDSICAPGTATLNAYGAGASDYLWYSSATGGSPLDTGITFTTPTLDSSRYYYVAGISGNCISSRVQVLAFAFPSIKIDLEDSLGFCKGTSIVLRTRNTDTTATYLWSDSTTADSLIVSAAGTYYVKVSSGNSWCSSTDTVIVSEYDLPLVDLGADSVSFCEGQSVMLLSGADSTNAILWNTGATTPDIEVDSAGSYMVTVTSPEGCINQDTIDVFVGEMPMVQGLSGADSGLCTFAFYVDSTQNVDYIVWNFGDGSAVDTTTFLLHTVHQYANPGNYTVTLIAVNDCGADTITTTVECKKTGIGDVTANNNLKVYPNPANQLLNVQYDGKTMMSQISIYNMVGQQVYQSSVNNTQHQLIVAQYASGIYQMRITLDNGEVLMKKFEVRK